MRLGSFAIGVLTAGLVAASAGADPIPAINVPQLTGSADFVVVGRAHDVSFKGSGAGKAQSFEVSVDRVLKGTPRKNQRISVRLDLSAPGSSGVREGRYGIFFLRQTSPSASYETVDPYHPALPATPGSPLPGPGASALAGIVQELSKVLATPPADLTADQRIAGVREGRGFDHVSAIYHAAAVGLGTLPYEWTGPALRSVADAGPQPGRLWAIGCLLTMRGPEELGQIKTSYLESIAPLLIDPSGELEPAAYVLALSIEGNITAPKAVPVLATLLRSKMVEIRRAAASVLGDIATPEVIAPLAKLALNDTDWDVRYFAIYGLAEATGAERAPTVAVYQEREAEILRRWRKWAKANVRVSYTAAP